jgi:hypothetical protein
MKLKICEILCPHLLDYDFMLIYFRKVSLYFHICSITLVRSFLTEVSSSCWFSDPVEECPKICTQWANLFIMWDINNMQETCFKFVQFATLSQ